jgi:putative hydrolase of the HAD superfamily
LIDPTGAEGHPAFGKVPISMSYQAVVFDFFGTLTRAMKRGPAHDQAAQALGCDPTAFTDMLDRTYQARASGRYGDAGTGLYRIARDLGRSPAPAQVARAVSLVGGALRDGIRLRPDAVRTLWRLQTAGLRTGLVSDCTEDLPGLFASMPVAALFDATVFSVHLGVTKPHPVLFRTVCLRLGVRPDQCLYVGDGGGRELSGARSVGMTAVRLAAPDLTGHLVFDSEPDWHGASVTSLSAVADLALSRRRAKDSAPAPQDGTPDRIQGARLAS